MFAVIYIVSGGTEPTSLEKTKMKNRAQPADNRQDTPNIGHKLPKDLD